MNVLLLMIPITLTLSFFFVGAFLWATRSGQWDDVDMAARKALSEDIKTVGDHDETKQH